MTGTKTQNWAEEVGFSNFGGSNIVARTPYLALFTSDPGTSGWGSAANEVPNSNGYSRQAISFGAESGGVISIDTLISFTTATGSWGTVTHFGICTAGTHGVADMLYVGSWDSSFAVILDDKVQVQVDAFTITESGDHTDYQEGRVLEALRGTTGTAYTGYLGLHTSDPGETGSHTNELVGNGYARIAANLSVDTAGRYHNNAQEEFPIATASWGTVTHVSIEDASSGGNGTYNAALAASKAVGIDDVLAFAADNLALLEA